MFIETHAHLHFPQLVTEGIENILARAKKNGVEKIINIATDLTSTKESIKLAEAHKEIYATAGIHPHDAEEAINNPNQITELEQLLSHQKVVAVGEVGLDYFKNYSPIDTQKKIFAQFLEMAIEHKLPVIIHNREADDDVFEMLQYYKLEKVVFHCYSSSINYAKKLLDKGYYLSFTGNITFPKNIEGQDVVKYVPLDRIMVETDCPFLAPVPHRGKINEPAFVKDVAEKIATLRNIDIETFARATTRNAEEFFNF